MQCIHDDQIDCDEYWQDKVCECFDCPIYREIKLEVYGDDLWNLCD